MFHPDNRPESEGAGLAVDQEGAAVVDPGDPVGPGEVVQGEVLPSPEMETETMAERVQHKLTEA